MVDQYEVEPEFGLVEAELLDLPVELLARPRVGRTAGEHVVGAGHEHRIEQHHVVAAQVDAARVGQWIGFGVGLGICLGLSRGLGRVGSQGFGSLSFALVGGFQLAVDELLQVGGDEAVLGQGPFERHLHPSVLQGDDFGIGLPHEGIAPRGVTLVGTVGAKDVFDLLEIARIVVERIGGAVDHVVDPRDEAVAAGHELHAETLVEHRVARGEEGVLLHRCAREGAVGRGAVYVDHIAQAVGRAHLQRLRGRARGERAVDHGIVGQVGIGGEVELQGEIL